MGTSNVPRPSPRRSSVRRPLRLRMVEHPGRDRLDGGWWPRSRHLAEELSHLVDRFPARLGRILHVQVSPPDWDEAPRRVRVADGSVEVGPSLAGDPHLVRLTTSGRTVLSVLVVPPGLTPGQGDEALLAAATSGNAYSASELLLEVTDHRDVDPQDHWSESGRPWGR